MRSGAAVDMPGDADITFEQFASDYRKRFLRYAVALCGEWHAAEDITQEMLIITYRRWRDIEPVARVGYARTVIVHLVMRAHRRTEAQNLQLFDELPNLEALLEKENTSEGVASRLVLHRALSELSDRQRRAVHLRYWGGLSTAEIAHALRVPAGTVRSDLARATARLRRVLAAVFQGAQA